MFQKYLKQLNLPESYVSITLGFLVVIVGGLLVYNNFIKGKLPESAVKEVSTEEKQEQKMVSLPATHKVEANENLWVIAEKYYKSGYNWVTITQENKLTNPNKIEVDQELVIPKADAIKPERDNVSATSTEAQKTYTIVTGDSLWSIAGEELGDGYAWVKIAQINNLINPNLIHAGNVLKLP